MFCGQCGTKNADNVEYCKNCGAKLKKGPGQNPMVQIPDTDKNKKVGMITVGVLVIIIILAAVLLFGGRSYKDAVKQYVNASLDADAEELLDLLPDKVIDYIMKEEGKDKEDLDEFIDDTKEDLQDQIDDIDSYLGEDWKVSYEITDDEDITGDDLDDIKEFYDYADVKVSAAKSVEVKVTLKADENEESNTLDISLIKAGRSWYLDVMSMGNIL